MGGIVTPVAVVMGLVIGFSVDIKDRDLYKKITQATDRFNLRQPSLSDARKAMDQLLNVLAPAS